MIQTKNLSFKYPNSEILSFPDIHCEAGESLLILGQSGVGKSTLLHLMGGLIKPNGGGDIFINNKNIVKLSNKELDLFRGQHIGIIFQKPMFIQSISTWENLKLFSRLAKKEFDINRMERILNNIGILHKKNEYPSDLSVGELQRLSIARALVNNPALILADEPSSALDDKNCKAIAELLQNQAEKEKAALVVVTHDKRLKDIFPQQIILSNE